VRTRLPTIKKERGRLSLLFSLLHSHFTFASLDPWKLNQGSKTEHHFRWSRRTRGGTQYITMAARRNDKIFSTVRLIGRKCITPINYPLVSPDNCVQELGWTTEEYKKIVWSTGSSAPIEKTTGIRTIFRTEITSSASGFVPAGPCARVSGPLHSRNH
jgi:hypothetical protein